MVLARDVSAQLKSLGMGELASRPTDPSTKGTLNKVVDALSRYYKHDYWTSMPELHDYIDTNVTLDPEHDDLPREQVFKIEEQAIETRV